MEIVRFTASELCRPVFVPAMSGRRRFLSTAGLLLVALFVCESASAPVAGFDVHLTVSGLSNFRLVDPNGRQLVVANDVITASEIPGVEAGINRVDDVNEDEAGPAYVEVEMRRPLIGVWKLRALVRQRIGATLTAYSEDDSLASLCDCADDVVMRPGRPENWALEIGSREGCGLTLKRRAAVVPSHRR